MPPPNYLFLRFNSINKITATSLAGLRELELFLVHGNNIHSLPDGAFRDLNSLQVSTFACGNLTDLTEYFLKLPANLKKSKKLNK